MEWEPYADLTSIMGHKETKGCFYTRGFDTWMFYSHDCCVVYVPVLQININDLL
jgi:hypothetical protein